MSLTVEGNIVKWLPSNIAGDNSGTATFYVVQYSSSDSPLVTDMIRTIQLTTDLTGYLVEGGRYRVRVRAGNSGGLSDWSHPVMFTAVDQSTNAPGNIVFSYNSVPYDTKFLEGENLASCPLC